jgi:hypothetical protein
MLCEHCQRNHESFCAKLAQLKARSAGFTVAGVPQGEHRHGHEIPPPTPPDRPREEPEEPAILTVDLPSSVTEVSTQAPLPVLDSSAIIGALAALAEEPLWAEKPGEITDDSFNSVTWVNAGPALPVDEVLESSADLGLTGIAPLDAPEPLDEGPRHFIIGKEDSE